MKQFPTTNRKVDILVESQAQSLGQRLRLVAKKQITLWKALLVGMFIAGFAAALTWAVSEEYFSQSKAAGGEGPFQESQGMVVIEAENFHKNFVGSSRTHQWEGQGADSQAVRGYSGRGYLRALPDINADDNPSLQYRVKLSSNGPYYVWVRGAGPDGNADSVIVGEEGAPFLLAMGDNAWKKNRFAWSNKVREQDNPAAITFAGNPNTPKVLQVWMREDGFRIDKIILTKDPDFKPSGKGPRESRRGREIVPKKPDLTITEIIVMPFYPTVGELDVTINVKGKNVGQESLTSGQGVLNFFSDFPDFVQREDAFILPNPTPEDPIDPGEEFAYAFGGSFVRAGEKQLYFKVDNANELEESNEDNNSLVKNVTVSDSGSLIISDDPSDPQNSLLVAGTAGQVVGEIRLSAQGENIGVRSLSLTASGMNGGNSAGLVDSFYLYDGSTRIGQYIPISFNSASQVIFDLSQARLIVPKIGGKKLTVKADLKNFGASFGPGESGQGFQLVANPEDIQAVGEASGNVLSASQKLGSFTSGEFHVFKSLPHVTRVYLRSGILGHGAGVPLYRFQITANPKGDVGFYKASFAIEASNVNLNNFRLYENPDTSNTLVTFNPLNFSPVLDVLIDLEGLGTSQGGGLRIIPAATTRTYELRGDVFGAIMGSQVAITMLSDPFDSPVSLGRSAVAVDQSAQDNFIWSDLSFGNSSSSATSTSEWFNGTRVPGFAPGVDLPQVLSR